MERSRGVTLCGFAIIAFGIYSLLGAGNFRYFSLMFKGLSQIVIFALYIFTVFYAICCVYCGTRILRLEDWSRKVILVFASISVLSGLLLNRLTMTNFKQFLISEEANITPDMYGAVHTWTVMLVVLVTLFELSVIFFFTRPGVVKQFKR